ncbi:MAG TPA: hypothetical protein VJP81_05425 [Candidatus Dormibacteraeota bacterium]|nr:hypothetical protein [Candidatus Dormibacteraeota bacterium]
MSDTRRIMCTLGTADLKDRGAAWRKLFASGLLHRQRVPGGVRLRAEPGAADALLQLIDLERECCAWIDYEVSGPVVTLTASGEGERVLAGMFLPPA